MKIEIGNIFNHTKAELLTIASMITTAAHAMESGVAKIAAEDNPATGKALPANGPAAYHAEQMKNNGVPVERRVAAPVTPAAFVQSGVHFDTPPAAQVFGGNVPGVASAPTPVISTPPTVSIPPVPPSVPAATVAPASSESDRDAAGLPWDERIHARTKAKNSDGTWRSKRGVDAVEVSSVEAELRALVGLPAVAVVNPMAAFKTAEDLGLTGKVPPPIAPTFPTAPVVIPVPSPVVIPPVPPVPPVAFIPPSTLDAAPLTFPLLVPKIVSALAAGQLTQDAVTAALAAQGLASLPALATRGDLVPVIAAALGFA